MRKKIFYGWYLAVIALICLLCAYGVRYSFGVFFPYMLKELHWSRTLLSGALSVSMLVNAVLTPVFGFLVDRYGPKALLSSGGAVLGLSLIVMRQFREPWQFYVIYGVFVALGINAMGLTVNNTMVTNWFVRKRAVALALATSGSAMGVFVFSPICNLLIKAYTWRASLVILGVALMVVTIPLTLLFARKRPEEMGLLPDGEEPGAGPAPAAGQQAKAAGPTVPVQEVEVAYSETLRSANFWLIFCGMLVATIPGMMATNHLVAFALEKGVPSGHAAFAFGLPGAVGVAFRFIWGYLADRMNNRKFPLLMAGTFGFLAFAVLSFVVKDTATLYVYALVAGLGTGGLALLPALVGDQFGRLAMGRAYGTINLGGAVGSAIGPVLGGWIYDVTHSYTLAWQIGTGLNFIALLCFLFVGKSLYLKKIEAARSAIKA